MSAETYPAGTDPSLAAPAQHGAPPFWVAPLFTLIAIAGMIGLRLVFLPNQITPIGYGIPLILFLWFRDRRWLWVATAAFAIVSAAELFIATPTNRFPTLAPIEVRLADMFLVLLELAIVSGVIHAIIGTRLDLERRNLELSEANRELAAREAQIARQNVQLQGQAKELERQGEEARSRNETLAGREHTLETLLGLSRALASDLSRDNTMRRLCDMTGQLLTGLMSPQSLAVAILEQNRDHFVVRCHHGFGDGGPGQEQIPIARTFASLVMADGRTAYLEDLSLRPDLSVPQPAQGEPFLAVLAAPLRVAGWPIGTLEVYSRQKGPWAPSQIALLESLAAQGSISLEAAYLFDGVATERRRLEAILRAAPIGIAVANADCSDIRLNPSGAAIFDVPPDTNVRAGSDAAAVVPAVTGPWLLFSDGHPVGNDDYPLIVAARGEEVRGREVEVLLPAGRRIVLLTNASPIRDREGNPAGAVAAFVDMTPQKELLRELVARRREAEEASVRKTRFLAAVSHDIRTPANAISLLAELIRRSAADPALAGEVSELAGELHGSTLALVALLSDVLDVARFDSARIELAESEFGLCEFLMDESRQMQPLSREKGLQLTYEPEEPLRLRTDRIKLSRVLGNLVGNAIKFTERGEIRVESARDSDGGICFRVSDTGIGIAEEDLRHIFDEFFQLRNPERDRNKGSGLGLTICKRLVDAMGGRLEVQSAPGQGSRFTVALPPSVVVAG